MEIQRKIIESYTSPSNKNVWWYNPSEGKTMRYINGGWKDISIANKSSKGPYLTTKNDNEINLYCWNGSTLAWGYPDMSQVDEEIMAELEEFIGKFTVTTDETRGCTIISVESPITTFNTGLYSSIVAIMSFSLSEAESGCFICVLPNSISKLETIEGRIDIPSAFVFGDKVSSISAEAIFPADIEGVYTYLQTDNPPALINNEDVDFSSGTVYIPKDTLDAYRKDSNWSYQITTNYMYVEEVDYQNLSIEQIKDNILP